MQTALADETPANTTINTQPTITSPTKNQVLKNFPRTATIKWTAIPDAKYYQIEITCDVCVSSTEKWKNPAKYLSLKNSYKTKPLAGDNQFRVRVRALLDNNSWGTWSNYRYFKYNTSSAVTSIGVPYITYPTANQVLTNYPRTTDIEWTSVSGANKYEIRIECDVCGSPNYSTSWKYFSTNNWYTTPALAGDNWFRVTVRAIGANGLASNWSAYTYFKYDTSEHALGTPSITSPTANQVLTNYPRTAYISWTAAVNAAKYEVQVECDICSSPNYSTTWTYYSTNNWYTTPALVGDNWFRVKVRAIDSSNGSGSWSSYRYFKYTTTPSETTLGTPVITSPTSNQVLTNYPRYTYIAWTSVSGASKYDIMVDYNMCGSSTYTNNGTYSSTNNWYTTPALVGDNCFRVAVRAVDANGNAGNWSSYRYFKYDTSAAATLGTPTITSPTASQVLTNYPRTAYIAWSSVANATKYDIQVECDTCGDSYYSATWSYSSTTNWYTTPALAGDNWFRVKVRAVNSSGTTGNWSSYKYFKYNTSAAASLGTPSITSPTASQTLTNYPRAAYIAWTSVTNATKYDIQVDCDLCGSSNYSASWSYSSTSNWYTTPALAGDNWFRVRVRAVNSSGTVGNWSSYVYFHYDTSAAATLGTPTVTSPTSNQALTNYPRTAYIAWSSVSNASKYEIVVECDVCSSPDYSFSYSYTSTNNWYTTGALAGDNWFRVKVRAIGSSGNTGEWSSYRYFKYDTSAYATPSTPSIIAPTVKQTLTNYPRYAYIEWTNISSASSYEIQIDCDVCSSPDYSRSWTYTSSNHWYTTPALVGDNWFRVKVRALNSSGTTGSWSDYQYFKYDTSGY